MSESKETGKFPLLLSGASFVAPNDIVQSAWLTHGAFAFWLIERLRPKTFVELGTHNGFSYFCFCQAVQLTNSGTNCHAVDTWTGDEHASFYGQEVFENVTKTNLKYQEFSQLMKMTFAEAEKYFSDNSVELLHIDGRHHYEDVKSDFMGWMPKLSANSIVLFHDTNVRERDFGVWKFFGELAAEYPSFNFLHGHGLGVLAPKGIPESLTALFEANDAERIRIRAAYARLGSADHARYLALERARQRDEEIDRQKIMLAQLDSERSGRIETAATMNALRDQLAEAQSVLNAYQAKMKDYSARNQSDIEVHEASILTLRGQISKLQDSHLEIIEQNKTENDNHRENLSRMLAGLTRAEYQGALPKKLRNLRWLIPGKGKKIRRMIKEYRLIAGSPLFDGKWYLEQNPDVANTGVDPAYHYLKSGAKEGRSPSPYFDGQAYTSAHSDLGAGSQNPLVHFLQFGYIEGRSLGIRKAKILEMKSLSESFQFNLPPKSHNPVVSIIIPTYGQVAHTLNCLESIDRHRPSHEFEILVVDDCSNDEHVAKLRKIEGIDFSENPTNMGFLRSVNACVRRARGQFLYILNNDTVLKENSIDALLDIAMADPAVGLVGSCLIYPDGRLQEAGGIVWNDASAWNYGRLDNPNRPEYQYVREVDYVSGASILVPRPVWDILGGFDEYYAPAYYEDTDFAFRVRSIGKKVLYQPRSVVFHFEGVSHGTDTGAGIKATQIVNQKKFHERWRTVLADEHFQNGEHVARARDRSKSKSTILIVDHYVPEPDKDAGSRNIFEFILSFRQQGHIVKFWPQNLFFTSGYTQQLQEIGVEVIYAPHVKSFADWMAANGKELDFVILSRPTVAPEFLDQVQLYPNIGLLYYGHDLHFERLRREFEIKRDPVTLNMSNSLETIERDIWKRADVVLYPSTEEIEIVKRLESQVDALPVTIFCFDLFAPRLTAPSGRKIAFVGGFSHSPNVDAALWFVANVLPLVLLEYPDVSVSIIGSNPTEEVKRLAGGAVSVTGWVSAEDLKMHYAQSRLSVVPLRFGAGVKLKVVEALVEGTPLVTTSIGAQGIPELGTVAAIAETAESFAKNICLLLGIPDAEWLEVSRRQLRFAEMTFGRQRQMDELAAGLELARAAAARRTDARSSL